MENKTIKVRIPKHLAEAMKKKIAKLPKDKKKEEIKKLKEAIEGDDKTVKITLDEYISGSPFEYDLGQWAIKNFPKLAKAAMEFSTSDDPGQRIVDLGSEIIGLATVGTIAVSASAAIFKDSLVSAAKKLISAVKGGVKEEEGGDADLAKIVGELPANIKAKIAKK